MAQDHEEPEVILAIAQKSHKEVLQKFRPNEITATIQLLEEGNTKTDLALMYLSLLSREDWEYAFREYLDIKPE
jgi:hypothetical protein